MEKKILFAAFVCVFVLAMFGTVGSSAVSCAEASGSYVAVKDKYVMVKLPKVWKKILRESGVYTEGHTSGIYHTDFTTRSKEYWGEYTAFRIDGADTKNNSRAVKSKTVATIKKKPVPGGDVAWSLRNAKGNTAWIGFRNAYLDAWDAAHGKRFSGVPAFVWKKLISTYSGGKTSYVKVKTWSRAKAKRTGLKAIRSYASKYIVADISLR